MAYQVYFADLTEENQALMLTILRLKEEGGRLEPGEAELLASLRGAGPRASDAEPEPEPEPSQVPRRVGPRRRSNNGRTLHRP